MDIDTLWDDFDKAQTGRLGKNECRTFLTKLAEQTQPERKANFNENGFEQLFESYDEDGIGEVEKGEMAVLIKKAFRRKRRRPIKIVPE